MSDKNHTDKTDSASPAKALFLGNILDNVIFPFPKISEPEKETLRMVVESIDRFMGGKDKQFREFDEKGEQPASYIQSLADIGLFGVIIPEEFGGLGLSNSGYARVIQQTSRYDASTSLTIGAHSSIGMKALLLFGTEEQKTKYLPRLASGEMIAGFCLTEPGSGSDAASIKTSADKQTDGSWRLNGEKLWITNGGIAGFYTVFAKTDGDKGKLSAFIVERDWTGVSNGPKEDKMGIRASSTTTVSFNDVLVPAECLLGGEGNGFKVAMSVLNNGRTGLGGGCVGGIKRCIALATRQATERKQFGRSISEFGLVKEKIADMALNCFATESIVSMVGHLIDSGSQDYSVEAAISKIFASESMWQSAHDALQIAAGNGFMKEMPYEMLVRDSRINLIFEGTNDILRLYVALSGMKDAGDHLKDIGKKLGNIFNDPIKGFGVLSQYATKRVSQLTPLGRDKIQSVVPALRQDALVYEQYTTELAKAVEIILRRHGKAIVEKQFAMKRVADVVIDMFVGLCTLSRVNRMIEEKGEASCKFEISMSHIYTQRAKRRMNQALRRVDINEDEDMKLLADLMLEKQGYPWDTI